MGVFQGCILIHPLVQKTSPESACAGRLVRRNPARRIVEFLPGQPSADSERGPAPPATDGERAARRRTRSLPRGMMLAAGLGSPVRCALLLLNIPW